MADPEQPILHVHDLRKSFGDVSILKGVGFDVEEGDLVSIIGPSGCGKSTLLPCLNALEMLDSERFRLRMSLWNAPRESAASIPVFTHWPMNSVNGLA